MERYHCALLLLSSLSLLSIAVSPAHSQDLAQRREQAQKLEKDGNYKEALDLYKELALAESSDGAATANDVAHIHTCLQELSRVDECDAIMEKIAAAHAEDWRVLQAVSQVYANGQHAGYMVAGEFHRGHHRGGGRHVYSMERDRVRAIQLLEQARTAAAVDESKSGASRFFFDFAQYMLNARGDQESWRLQTLTDLTVLPDYSEQYDYSRDVGTPVDRDGNPVYYGIPTSWEAAANDGERWRWLLAQAMELSPAHTGEALNSLAAFLHDQFGVQTMANRYRDFFGSRGQVDEDDGREAKSGTYELHTLTKKETITRLANGIRRHTLPDEFNFISLYERLAKDPLCTGYAENALNTLAQIFENRRQYETAAAYWQESIERFGAGHSNWKRDRQKQILDNWGRFDGTTAAVAGTGTTVGFVFRNATGVSLEARRINVPALLDDIKNYLKSNPRRLEWDRIQLGDIGYRLVHKDPGRYTEGEPVASWDLRLEPADGHWDKRMQIATNLKRAGAYLLTATVDGGNVSHVVVWVNDTVIAQKTLDRGTLYYVADAVTGKPVEKATVEFFGYRGEWKDNRQDVHTTRSAEFTDGNGQVICREDKYPNNFTWLLTVTKEGTERFAYLGFTSLWYGDYYDADYNETKVFTITDRPVYLPDQTVHLKGWVRHAKYDKDDVSSFAGHTFELIVNDPKGGEVLKETLTADAYGGINTDLVLANDATLGAYGIQVVDPDHIDPVSGDHVGRSGIGSGSFRVEEYKKPEYEVIVTAPAEPVMLGEKIKATIEAKYYFGAPVTTARVTYKVLRHSHEAQWYPPMPWEWLYGPGYWWFAYDYDWYPGWGQWGCRRPSPWWWHRATPPPELVSENDVEIGEDGKVEIEIDTSFAKAVHGDMDHRYEITAEVVDASRRTIVGQGKVLVARKPFKVTVWTDRGHYRIGDVIQMRAAARTLDANPVQGKGKLTLYRVSYDKDGRPKEDSVQSWVLGTDPQGAARQQIAASEAGQYRLAYTVTDNAGHAIEGAYMLVVRGENFDGRQFRFSQLELVNDKPDYKPGDTVKLMLNTDHEDSTVLLFVRPSNGVCLVPRVLRLDGKSTVEEIVVTKKDMPNFFVEALTVSEGKVYTEVREIIVPPETRVLNVDVVPVAAKVGPGKKAGVTLKLTDFLGKPFVGSAVVTVYDKALEYVSGGSNVGDIKSFFWKWRRRHEQRTEDNVSVYFSNIVPPNKKGMEDIGVFGHSLADEERDAEGPEGAKGVNAMKGARGSGLARRPKAAMSMAPAMERSAVAAFSVDAMPAEGQGGKGDAMFMADDGSDTDEPSGVEPVVRTKFADLVFWTAALETDSNGVATVEFDMPENLTTWKVKTWAMGHGTKVGAGETEIMTSKDLIIRLQAPRFFVEKDEVVLSAVVHNYLDTAKDVDVVLELGGDTLKPMADGKLRQRVHIGAGGESRVDWRVKVTGEGEATITMKALTDVESDAMQMTFPVYVHGMLKMDSFSGVVRPDGETGTITLTVPKERRIAETRLEIRYSPTLAGALVDALPYLADYPYGCTEQTLSRFLPTVLTQKILIELGVDLAAIKEKRTNLNAQEIGNDVERAKQWQRWDRNPVFDTETVTDMTKEGLKRLTDMQCADGGWGWFSGYGECSYAHTTAYVVHGLQVAQQNGVALVPDVLPKGIRWLVRHQEEQVQLIKNAPEQKHPWKTSADNLDAFVFMVLVDGDELNTEMRDFLYRDRNHLSVYAKAMTALAMHAIGKTEERDMLRRNIEQYLVQDDENQTAYLKLGNEDYWWNWYGSEIEAHAYFLKLLNRVAPKGDTAPRLVKYLLNNRKHATYWSSTRDTAVCIEAMAEYVRASGEDKPDMTVRIGLDGRELKSVRIRPEDLFMFDNKLVLEGDAVDTGAHTVTITREGKGPVYYNAYLSNFTLEDFITRAGLEVKVDRRLFKLEKVDKTADVVGAHGQAVNQKVETFKRIPLASDAILKSGDLVEVELVIESKNDYEYLVFEDFKAAGFEPVDLRSGYTGNEMNAYVEFHNEKVAFFVRQLARGKHSVSYRLRAEIPGRFSALPARGYAMYAPELKGNSDEIKLRIED